VRVAGTIQTRCIDDVTHLDDDGYCPTREP